MIQTPTDLGPSALLSRLANALRSLLREAQIPFDRLLAVGAGAPGAVDRERGMEVALAGNATMTSLVRETRPAAASGISARSAAVG